jgi:FMN phosphatase YigB (HAD superfamily)
MKSRYDVLTFDCYGTLIDWERGIGDAFEAAARVDGVTPDRAAVLRAYHEIEPLVQAERYRTYREVLTLTAQQVGSYKPAPAHLSVARQRIGAARWLHVAQSLFHDIQPARAHGIPAVWINRKREPLTGADRPDREFATLGEATAWLTNV